MRYVLASPTGRAAKRLSEATDAEAKTIHRLLEYSGMGGGQQFKRNRDNPLPCDVLVVDEASMLDVLLCNSLLKAIPPAAHVLFVGDTDQLPSVGPGNVLRDLINSWAVTTVQLDRVFRQAEGSGIIDNAHRINGGEMPLPAGDDPPGDGQGTPLVDHANHQGHTAAPNGTPIDDQHQGDVGQALDQRLGERQEVEIGRHAGIGQPAAEAFNPALPLSAIGQFASNRWQAGLAAADDPIDQGRQRDKVAHLASRQRVRIELHESIAYGTIPSKAIAHEVTPLDSCPNQELTTSDSLSVQSVR
jgi:hypothetical protein